MEEFLFVNVDIWCWLGGPRLEVQKQVVEVDLCLGLCRLDYLLQCILLRVEVEEGAEVALEAEDEEEELEEIENLSDKLSKLPKVLTSPTLELLKTRLKQLLVWSYIRNAKPFLSTDPVLPLSEALPEDPCRPTLALPLMVALVHQCTVHPLQGMPVLTVDALPCTARRRRCMMLGQGLPIMVV